MPAGKGRYTIGAKGTHGCKGYPVVGGEGKVHGCHPSKGAARAQQRAIYASENSQKFTVSELEKAMVSVGDFVIASTDNDVYVGRVEHVMSEGAVGIPGSEHYMEATSDNPAVVVRILEFDNDTKTWDERKYLINVAADDVTKIEPLPIMSNDSNNNYDDNNDSNDSNNNYDDNNDSNDDLDYQKMDCCPDEAVEKKAPCWDGYVQRGMKEKDGKMVPNCVPVAKANDLFEDDDTVEYDTDSMNKADGYSPPAGVRAAASKAIKFREDGKANGAGTSVGWTRAGQLARGETISLSTVKRMYSYFSRHEVDKKGKDWGNQANPSNGYIMWLAWGGDAGFAWSKRIVQAEMDKALFSNFGRDFTHSQRMTQIFKD